MVDEQHVKGDENSGSKDDQNQANKPGDTPANSGEQMIPKSRFDQVLQQKKDAVETLKSVVDELVENLPENYRDLVPADLSPEQQIKWIRKAEKSGLFIKQVESGPGSKRPGGKQKLDLSNMKPEQMMSAGYNK